MTMLLTVSLWLIIGAISAYWAQIRGRDPVSWFVIGMLLGLFGLIVLFLLPKLEVKSAPEEEVSLPPKNDSLEISPRFKEWYYLNAQNLQQGPVSFLSLEKLLDQGELGRSTLVWSEGMPDWQPVELIPELESPLSERAKSQAPGLEVEV